MRFAAMCGEIGSKRTKLERVLREVVRLSVEQKE